MPALFIGHGSPENILLDNDFTRALKRLGGLPPKPRAILVVSAHWLTDGTYVTCVEKPRTIHDFYGFQSDLYRVTYPSPGSPQRAKTITELFENAEAECDFSWGLGHASWAILKHIYPRADIPVIEMSLDYSPHNEWKPRSLGHYYDIAKRLEPLREEDVLIIGSGNIVHNLRVAGMRAMEAKPYRWAVEFDEAVRQSLLERNHGELLNCQNMGPTTALAVPTLDHYLPMIFAVALQQDQEPLEFVHEGFQNRSVSIRCFKIG
jgi:4,5-DOPA dioxygenase extradiol